MENHTQHKQGKVYLGCDKTGYEFKNKLKSVIDNLGFLVVDLGVFNIEESADSPIIAREVAEKVVENLNEDSLDTQTHGCNMFGILVNETGISMMMSANKVEGARATVCTTEKMAEVARFDTDANILCLGSSVLDLDLAEKIVAKFLQTSFSGSAECVKKVKQIEYGK